MSSCNLQTTKKRKQTTAGKHAKANDINSNMKCLKIIIEGRFQLNKVSWKTVVVWCYTQTYKKVHVLCNHWEYTLWLCFVASFRDKPPCGAEDFLFCFEYRGFSHISNHKTLIADKYHREHHHIKLVCFCTLTISHCNNLETGVHNRLSGFFALQVCIRTT